MMIFYAIFDFFKDYIMAYLRGYRLFRADDLPKPDGATAKQPAADTIK